MKLFTTLFDLAKLPLIIAKDVVCALPDAASMRDPFEATKELCEKLDEDLEG